MNPAAETIPSIDREFLDSVEKEIAQFLERTAGLDSDQTESHFDPKNTWFDAFDRLNANLAGWQGQLAELTERTSAAEAELSEQETALRTWMQLMGITSTRLSQASETPTA
jgi:chromosome segregation ATPase